MCKQERAVFLEGERAGKKQNLVPFSAGRGLRWGVMRRVLSLASLARATHVQLFWIMVQGSQQVTCICPGAVMLVRCG